jgi:tetratricopeptide (TPR) repeat protein
MKHLWVLLLVVIAAGGARADADSLKQARERLLRGNYAEARELYSALAKEPKFQVAAALGLSRAFESEGEYDKALEAVEQALAKSPADTDLMARRAQLHHVRGRCEEASKDATGALAGNDNNFLAHWVLGQVHRDRGELDEADKQFLWFVRTYSARSNADKDITDPEQLILVGLAASERGRRHSRAQQFQFILNDIYKEAVKQDKNYWWGEYYAGRLLLEKHNRADAFKAFERALAINGQAAEVYAAKGQAALQRLEIKDAALFVEEALRINPRLSEALRLQADVQLFSGEMTAARKTLDTALAVNPREEATLARLAAFYWLQHKHDDFAAVVKKTESLNPKPAVFYYELAERLDESKHYDEAGKYYELSIKCDPKLPWAQSGLGLLYMRLGNEDSARTILEKAFEADKFNVRVYNTLEVLDHLQKYATLKTEHFHLRYDPNHDQVLARFMAKYLEDIYKELADKFQYRPKGPILIEVFNKHEMFSGRVVSLPDLHTIGACTGRMMAMVSPRDKSKVIAKPFNWVRVLRHELVHIFNLEQTKFQVPHWFTEGLAVANEGFGPPPRWHHLLAERVASGELLNLDNILLGFVRPRDPEEWNLAYLQSLLYVEHIEKTQGKAALGGLLAAYADGLDTASALKKVCNIDKADFEKGYREFLRQRVKEIGVKAPPKSASFKKLKEAHAKDPNDAEIAAQLAEHYLKKGDKKQARHLSEAVLLVKKDHPTAAYVKARLLAAGGQTDEALSLLQGALDPKTAEPKLLKFLGKLQVDAKKYAEAAETFEIGRKLEPHENTWLIALAALYRKTDNPEKLMGVLKALIPTDADDLTSRRELAQLLLKTGQAAEAERYAREALEIDVLDSQSQETLEAALSEQNKEDELRRLRELLQE